jgi:hypothetical protein
VLDTLFRPEDLSKKFPGKKPNYWAKLRCSGEGPEFVRIGGRIFYEEAAIERWVSTKRRINVHNLALLGRRPSARVDGPSCRRPRTCTNPDSCAAANQSHHHRDPIAAIGIEDA